MLTIVRASREAVQPVGDLRPVLVLMDIGLPGESNRSRQVRAG